MDKKGYVQVYTGNGKGKTTAVLGLIMRAVGAGKKVFFGQFLKDDNYSEIIALRERFPEVTVEQYGCKCGFILGRAPKELEVKAAVDGLEKGESALLSGNFDIIILDEINVAANIGLISEDKVLELIDKKPDGVELILTGRGAGQKTIEKADLVSEIMEIKHYFNKGISARVGIEK